jgi:hypothetical protein
MESQIAAIAGRTLRSESPSDSRVDFHIAFGSPAFFKANVALFAAGFVTFALLLRSTAASFAFQRFPFATRDHELGNLRFDSRSRS